MPENDGFVEDEEDDEVDLDDEFEDIEKRILERTTILFLNNIGNP